MLSKPSHLHLLVTPHRYKFLLNLDGFTAAYRFSKLLLINSVILKEYSANGEYFYRCGPQAGACLGLWLVLVEVHGGMPWLPGLLPVQGEPMTMLRFADNTSQVPQRV